MVGGNIGGRIHYRVNWKWRTILNLCAYSVKDPSTLTHQQRFSRLYRSCLRRLFMLNVVRLKWIMANHRNYFDKIEEVREEFEKAKKLRGDSLDLFIKEKEEWLELTFFPAVSQWPSRQYTNKYHLNVAYPNAFIEHDPFGYYKPRPILGTIPSAGPYFHEYPRDPNYFAIEEENVDNPFEE